MAKGKGKKSNGEEQAMNRPNANLKNVGVKKKSMKKSVKVKEHNAETVPSPAPAPQALPGASKVVACAPATIGGTDAVKEKEAINKTIRHSGYIFMCNQNTKAECFQYRVFGLPAGKREVIERIKEPTKLFLFDYDLKLLYGVYRAIGQGQMKLEPSAFGGRFPAQVKFSISRDCIPLPESVFKSAIKDNYKGSKFDPALNSKQVRSLQMLFRAIDMPRAPPVAPYLAREPPRQDPYNPHVARLPPPVDPYVSHPQYSHHLATGPRVDPLPVSRHEFYGSAGSMGLASPTMEQQRLPAHPSGRYYVVEDRHPYLLENSSQFVRDPYPRYRGVQEKVPHVVETVPRRSPHGYGGVQEMVLRGVETVPRRSPHGYGGGQDTVPRGVEMVLHQPREERRSEQLEATIARYYNPHQTSDGPNNTYPSTAASYHSYSATTAPHAQALRYPPRSVGSERAEPPRGSAPVSSYYSFAGPRQVYR